MDRRWPWSRLALAGIAVLAAAACGTYRPQDVKPGMGEAEVGALIGRHIYHYAQPIAANGMPIPGGGQLWRWAPSASSGGPPAAAAAACAASAAVVNGHTAGIAISVLLLVVVTALTAMTAQALGVVPACGLPGRPPRGAPSIGPAGFYSSSSKSAISGGYVAPSDAI